MGYAECSKKNLGHECNAERESGTDDEGLIEFELASQPHLHNVREQIDWSELGPNPAIE